MVSMGNRCPNASGYQISLGAYFSLFHCIRVLCWVSVSWSLNIFMAPVSNLTIFIWFLSLLLLFFMILVFSLGIEEGYY